MTKTTNNQQGTLFKTKPNKANQSQKMMLHSTINGLLKSFRYYADEIEAAATIHHVFCGATHACRKSMGREGENIWRFRAHKMSGPREERVTLLGPRYVFLLFKVLYD